MSKRPLRDRKTNFSHSSTNHKNLAKIGTVDAEIIGLTEIVKNKKTEVEQKPAFGWAG